MGSKYHNRSESEQMGLFGSKDEHSIAVRTEAWAAEHGLQDLRPEYKEMLGPVMEIETDIFQKKIEGAKPESISQEYLAVIKEQNWMIIRLLNDLNRKV